MTSPTGEVALPGGLITDWSVLGFEKEYLKSGSALDLIAFLATRGRLNTWSALDSEGWSSAPAWEWKLMLTGLDGAIARYEDARGKKPVWDARVAVGEAVWWVASLTEFLGSSFPSTRAFYQQIGSTRHGRLVGGLTFFRNRANHQVALGVMELERVEVSAPLTLPGTGPTVVTGGVTFRRGLARKLFGDHTAPSAMAFEALQDLPDPDPTHPERLGRDTMYQEEVELREVGAALMVARDSFKQTFTLKVSNPATPAQTSESGEA